MYLKPCQQSCVYWWVVIGIHPENNLMMLTNLVFHFAYNCKDSPFFLLYKKFPSYLCTPVVRTSCKGPGGKHLVFLDCVVSVPTTDCLGQRKQPQIVCQHMGCVSTTFHNRQTACGPSLGADCQKIKASLLSWRWEASLVPKERIVVLEVGTLISSVFQRRN